MSGNPDGGDDASRPGECRDCDVDAETFDELLAHSDATGHWVLSSPGA